MRAHERAASPPFWTHERGFAAYGRFVAVAAPRVLDTRTLISCRWDNGGDGHRRIMAKHRVGVEPLFLGLQSSEVHCAITCALLAVVISMG